MWNSSPTGAMKSADEPTIAARRESDHYCVLRLGTFLRTIFSYRTLAPVLRRFLGRPLNGSPEYPL